MNKIIVMGLSIGLLYFINRYNIDDKKSKKVTFVEEIIEIELEEIKEIELEEKVVEEK